MPKNKRQARQVTARRQKRAAKRRNARKQARCGQKTQPAAQRRSQTVGRGQAVSTIEMLKRMFAQRKDK